MRYAILGDIHSNETALQAVLKHIDRENVDVLVSVGDVVGYGPSPGACISLLRERDAVVVKGNHDSACVGELSIQHFNNYARKAVIWTKGVLTKDECKWLSALPLSVELNDCEVSHGSLFQPELFNYTQSISDADLSLETMKTPVCFVGHTHVPVTLWRPATNGGTTEFNFEVVIALGEASKSLVNVGSVGQPRDEDPRAAYALFDSKQQTVELRRVQYDIDLEAAMFRDAGLPDVLAERLYLGV